MRTVPFLISAAITAALVFALNKRWGAIPAMGKFLSPQQGFWQNAEPVDFDFNSDLKVPGLKGKAEVYLDERLVPHVFAENDEDLYFLQGYLHAKFRLFQMDLQTKAAEGRASEIAGPKAVNYDKAQRRLGMRFAAENALREIEKDPVTLSLFNAYTKGVNAYIHSLRASQLPLEYKLLGFEPEEWSNLRTALLLKMMAQMLSSGTQRDLEYTNAKQVFSQADFNRVYPQVPDSLLPIVPKGTVFDTAAFRPAKPADADSLYLTGAVAGLLDANRPDPGNGSNNWVVAGAKTQSGAPILCNDPHLELSLPSIWFEMQLSTPTSNAYGVSLPGSPFIIIGFNEQIAWGVTNAQRDVKDFFEIRFRDESRKEYWFEGGWKPVTQTRAEKIRVKGGETVIDTVVYTVFGPVMYDRHFSDTFSNRRTLAVKWIAHEPSNEAMTFYRLNRATNYDEYVQAISTFNCPGQNFVFASKTGDIALWQQGKFPARWQGQGLYIMPGDDNRYNWQGYIPQDQNPHAKNPERGFLESANQRPADSTYPYFIPGTYITPRAIAIEHYLSAMNGITVQDMMKLQNNYFNTLAEDARPVLLKYVNEGALSADAKRYLAIVKGWNLEADPASKGQTVYQCWWDSLEVAIWQDDISRVTPAAPVPEDQTTVELLLKDSTAFPFADNRNTPQTESLADDITMALNRAATNLVKFEKEGRLEWSKFKEPGIYHLTDKGKNALLPFARTKLNVGGSGSIINAVTQSHGPSWRMIVQLSSNTEAYGVYPAGQSGNPGSRYYDNFVDTWVKGEYFRLWMMKPAEASDPRIKWKMHFEKE